ncbi:diguanylate cyclase [Solemya pervernicosa gill symbiont]|uniref:diguanylate cyclase n=2 Tax=Gammaproteobacteria incertae sedis TaxID=118884 RepID=A0A1T2L5G1_9GAMM|nr:sensor domain-containing diguanylate cyclase [Candidatus Reidiella endopervernicosa]OOZ40176.1 diguanylate cyclase [Solemya pervernicosa gill symbiont]QKQ25118.1 diguanylate cyclase [Candidatus Reidiella endopervernicosa]
MGNMDEIRELHLLLGVLQNVDVGLVVLDRDYRITLWNGFMENHSGVSPADAMESQLFERFPDLPEQWLRNKAESVFTLNNRAFSNWRQRPYLFKFNSYHPITGLSDTMYQDMTIIPMVSINGQVDHVCVIIYDVTEMAVDEQQLKLVNDELDRIGRTDGLTQLYNRSAWEEHLHEEFKRMQRGDKQSVLVMFDIDHFKRVNDGYGHQAGDEVIRATCDALRKVKRSSDIAGRYGGEEFAVILADTDRDGGRYFAERLRKAIEKNSVEYGNEEIQYTISLGVAEYSGDITQHLAWLERADQALYKSKEGGRNQVTLFGE